MSDHKIEALGRVPLFAGCSRKDLEFLITRTDEVDVPAGQTLIKQGSPGDTFYLLLDGQAGVQVDGRDRPPLGVLAGLFFFGNSLVRLSQSSTFTPALVMM